MSRRGRRAEKVWDHWRGRLTAQGFGKCGGIWGWSDIEGDGSDSELMFREGRSRSISGVLQVKDHRWNPVGIRVRC